MAPAGSLAGWLCPQTVCRLPARQCAARCWATMRTQECAALGERRRPATTSSRWRRGRRTSMTSPGDLPEICGRRLTGAPLSRHDHPEARAATHAENAFLECWGSLVARPGQDVRPLKTAVQGLQLVDGDSRPTKCRVFIYQLTVGRCFRSRERPRFASPRQQTTGSTALRSHGVTAVITSGNARLAPVPR